MKRIFPVFILVLITVCMLTAASPLPSTTFTLVQGLSSTMNVGDVHTVIVQVTSDQEFLLAQALPSFQFPGKGVVAVQGGDHAGRGTSTSLEVTFVAKRSTANLQGGAAPIHVVVGVRYPGGYVAVQDFLFNVTVP
jgi:hypothetical protein